MNGWLTGFAISFLLFGVLSFIASKSNYQKRFQMSYSLRNTFPYEFNYESKFTDNILGNVLLILSLGTALGFYSTINVDRQDVILLVAAIAGILLTILIGVNFFLPLKLLKTHMTLSIFQFLMSFIVPASIAISALSYYKNYQNVIPLVVAIISSIFAVFNFALVMNPKLSLNIKMDVITNDDGTETYKRPKFITFAFTEWITIINSLIYPILILVMFYSIA